MPNFLITLLASFLIWFLFLGLIVLWIIDGKIKREQVLHALFAVSATWLIAKAIKILFPIPRPFMIDGSQIFTILTHTDGAFPSVHTGVAFALSITIWLHDAKVGIFFIITSVLIGIGRIIGNVHYPVDILGGAVLGTLVALFFDKAHLSSLLKRK